MSTSEEAALNVAAPQQTPQEELATEPAAVPGSAVSEPEEIRPVDDTTQTSNQTALQEVHGPHDGNLFHATTHDPVASLPPVNTVS